jgi:hypothetical protein
MAVLIRVYDRDGTVHRCDARCYNRVRMNGRECVCGGANAGVGHRRALLNSAEHHKEWMREWKKKHPEALSYEIQLSFDSAYIFPLEEPEGEGAES